MLQLGDHQNNIMVKDDDHLCTNSGRKTRVVKKIELRVYKI